MKSSGKLIIKGHDKNPFVKFWNWGWGIYYKNPEFWNYVIVGALTTLVAFVVKFIMWKTICDAEVDTYFNQQFPVDISWVIAVAFAYVTNRIFVFKSKNKKIFKEICSFVLSRVTTLIMEKALTYLFVTILLFNKGLLLVLQMIFINVLIMIGNYILSKLFVFRKNGV